MLTRLCLMTLSLAVSLPAAAQKLSTTGECSRIVRAGKRARCNACIQRKGIFHAQGAGLGACDVASPGAKQAVTAVLAVRTPAGCRNRIANAAKRRRCVACVRRGQVFHKWGGKLAGVCSAPGQVPRGALPPPAPGLIVARAGCISRVKAPAKRKRCEACVAGRRVFRPLAAGGRGRCTDAGKVAAGVARAADTLGKIHLLVGCKNRLANAAKRRRCMRCVRSGQVFHKFAAAGAGECVARGQKPKAPVGAIFAPGGCKLRLASPAKRRACLGCVGRGQVYFKFANQSRGACKPRR